MRIISKFHDYYDGVMKQGSDLETLYTRETKTLPIERKDEDSLPEIKGTGLSSLSQRNPFQSEFKLLYFGFCGKVLPAVQVRFKKGTTQSENYVFSFNEFKKLCEEEGLPVDFRKKKAYSWSRYMLDYGRDFEKFFSFNETKSLERFFSDYNIPVFIYKPANSGYKNEIVLNPNLKEFQFYKLKDAYSCFQEIYMYLSGVLRGPSKPMIEVSDKDKVYKHGFDKWSFRKKSESSSD